MFALVVVALSVGLDNFGASIAIGAAGADRTQRVQLVFVFGLFEGATPALGLLVGHALEHGLGSLSHPIAGAVLGLAGAVTLVMELAGAERQRSVVGTGGIFAVAAVLSVDNLAVGFGLGAYRTGLAVSLAVIAATSILLSLLGLELGARLRSVSGRWAELTGGLVLVAMGVLIGTGVL